MSRSPTTEVAPEKALRYSSALSQLARLVKSGMSHSGREKNCVFLNTENSPFATVSSTSGLDFSDDARALAYVDWDQDGDLDLWLANRSGPQIRFLNNKSQKQNFLALRLIGRTVNRDAIGARVTVLLEEESSLPLIRTLRAGEGFLSQSSKWLHFGLGSETKIREVTIHWPGGKEESIKNLQVNQRYQVLEGLGALLAEKTHGPLSLSSSLLEKPKPQQESRVWLPRRIPLPQVTYSDFHKKEQNLNSKKPALLNLWGSWCLPCQAELKEWTQNQETLKNKIEIIALNIDSLSKQSVSPKAAKRFFEKIRFPFASGHAPKDLVTKLEIIYQETFGREISFPIPSSFLIDEKGYLAAFYLGPVSLSQLEKDIARLPFSEEENRSWSDPLSGKWRTPLPPLDLSFIAQSYLQAGYHQDALQLFEKIISSNPKRVTIHNQMGAAFMLQGEFGKAEKHYRFALQRNPRFSKAHYNLGILLAEKKQLPQAIKSFQKAIEVSPEYEEAHYSLGLAFFLQGKTQEAKKHYQIALKINPAYFEALYALGNAFARERKLPEAQKQFQEALLLKPNDSQTQHDLGLSYFQQRKNPQAIFHYKKALEKAPQNPEIHNSLGVAFLQEKKYDKAITYFTQAIKKQPHHASAHYNLATTFLSQKKIGQAQKHYQKALEINPHWPLPMNALAWIYATSSQIQAPQKAITLAEKACQLVSFSIPEFLDTLAASYAANKQFTKAIEVAEKAKIMAESRQRHDFTLKIEKRLALYRKNEMFLEE